MKMQIKQRWTGAVIFEGEIEAKYDGHSYGFRMGLLVKMFIDKAGADLTDADLTRADLTDADLTDADLTRADLTRANLTDADLTRADLTDADLTGANLTGANLTRANLTGANLTDADLTGADLENFKQDMIAEVLKVPNELEYLRNAIVDGKINGSMYNDDEDGCSCLCGTIGRARAVSERGEDIPINGITFRANVHSPRERWFGMIRPKMTPENCVAAKKALEWLDEAIMIRDHIRGQ